MSIKTYGQIKKGIESIKKTKQFESSSLSQIEQIFKFSLNVKRSAKKKIKVSSAFSSDSSAKVKKGKHLADFSKIEINRNFLLDKFNKICEIQSNFSDEILGGMKKIEKGIEEKKINFREIQKNLAQRKMKYFSRLAKGLGVDRELLYSTFFAVYKPVFELCAEEKKDEFQDYSWKKGSCPLCGANASMARFEKEVGRRELWCPVCGTEWTFKRVQCPFCGNENQDRLRFFYINEKSPYRVDVCDVCKGYVKTIDERRKKKTEKLIFEFENIKSLFLDDIAKKEGFKKY